MYNNIRVKEKDIKNKLKKFKKTIDKTLKLCYNSFRVKERKELKMDKKEMINKLNKIMNEVEELQLELGTMLVKDSENQELNFADNTLENAFNNLVDTEYHLKKSL